MGRRDSIHILLVEDNPADARLLQELLESADSPSYAFTPAVSLCEAQAAVGRIDFDLVLLDPGLPDSQGLASLQRLHQAAPALPIVVVTGLDDDQVALAAVQHGAQDYVVKGRLDAPSLIRAIRYAIDRHQAAEAIRESEARSRHLVETLQQVEARQALTIRVLELLSGQLALPEALPQVVASIRKVTGLEAVALRLRQGDDYPYGYTEGFPESFIASENSLVRHDTSGRIVADAQGRPVLECMCGLVVLGRPDTTLPCFSPGGSFWTNSTTRLLNEQAAPLGAIGTRNRCHEAGYESVALIPLRTDGQIIGLLHLVDSRPGMLPPEMIRFFEGLGNSLGSALHRAQLAEAVRTSEEQYRALFENMLEGCAYCKMIFDDQRRPVDWIYLAVNKAFEPLAGLAEAAGKRVSEILPGLRETNPELFEFYGRVADTGVAGEMESYVPDLKVWFHVSAFRPAPDHFVAVFENINERKAAEKALRENEEKYRNLVEHSLEGIGIARGNRVIFANETLVKIFGYDSAEELMRVPLLDLVAPGSRELIQDRWRRKERGEDLPGRFEYRILRKNGEVRDLEISTSAIELDGEPCTQSTFRDVTDRKRAEEKMAVYRDRLRALGRKLATAEDAERRRIAADLHDDVVQALAAARLRLQMIEPGRLPAPASGSLDEALRLVQQAIHNTRTLMFDISPPPLYELGLEAALEWLAEKIGQEHKLAVTVTRDPETVPLAVETRSILFRAVRELLVNVVKHARAHRAEVSVHRDDGGLRLEVADDGRGFDADGASAARNTLGGFGLFEVRERMDYIGGRLQIESRPEGGTRATLWAPLSTVPKGNAPPSP
jgi:PAS domain S-box-containing protein